MSNPMTNLKTLADRVEAGSGNDRELDLAIFRAIGAPVPFQFANKMVALVYDEAEQCYFAPVGDMRVRYEPPAYTASIDAAMTLVPEGWFVHFLQDLGLFEGVQWTACLWSKGEEVQAQSWAANSALALTAACLRARSRLSNPKGDGDE